MELNKISRYKSITGYEKSLTDIQSRISAIEFSNPQNTYKQVSKRVAGLFRNVRTWVMGEQLTLQYYNFALESLSAGISYKTFVSVYRPVGTIDYAIKNQHIFTESSYSIFKAPQAADYLVTVYSIFGFDNVAVGDKYVETLVGLKIQNGSWNTPFAIAGGGNLSVTGETETRIQTSGSTLVRMNRGDSLRVGWNNIGSDGAAIQSPDCTGMEIRVSISKVKFYPELS